jgi:hypothetical protein
MATRGARRPKADVIDADRQVLRAVAEVSGYAPTNPAYSVDTLRQLDATLAEAEATELRLLRELEATRERITEAAIALHQGIKGTRAQFVALFGPDSLALHAVGLKKQSEYKLPVRQPKSN